MRSRSHAERQRLLPLYGKPGHMDHGLSGTEVRRVAEEAGRFWLAAAPSPRITQREEPPLVPKERLFHCRDHAEIARGFRNA